MLRDDIARVAVKYLESEDLQIFMSQIDVILNNYNVTKSKNEIVKYDGSQDDEIIKMFFVSKKIGGFSDRSIKFYGYTIRQFRRMINKPLGMVTTSDVRLFLGRKQIYDNSSPGYLNDMRRILSSFFKWLTAEKYISSNPMVPIGNIKEPKMIKKPFSEIEIERLRENCLDSREQAIIETLLSTGCRAAELISIDVENIDFINKEITVVGKGNKERVVYLNAKSVFELNKYIKEYQIEHGPLFISKQKRKRLGSTGLQTIIKNLGKRAKVTGCHPHRFRRTMATLALNRGMPIEQVQQLLGHEDISTTTLYARSDKFSLREAHRKYVI